MTSSYTAHKYKLGSEHYRDCNGNSSAHVQGRRQLDLVIRFSVHVIQHLLSKSKSKFIDIAQKEHEYIIHVLL